MMYNFFCVSLTFVVIFALFAPVMFSILAIFKKIIIVGVESCLRGLVQVVLMTLRKRSAEMKWALYSDTYCNTQYPGLAKWIQHEIFYLYYKITVYFDNY